MYDEYDLISMLSVYRTTVRACDKIFYQLTMEQADRWEYMGGPASQRILHFVYGIQPQRAW